MGGALLRPAVCVCAVVVAVTVLGCGGGTSPAMSSTPATPSAPSAPANPVTMTLTSPVAVNGGALPADHTCDGSGASPALAWSGAPPGTQEFALLMTTLPGDGTTKWNWVLYSIPATVSALEKNSANVGVPGVGSDGPLAGYQPPCSQGPGAKTYTFTIYALSAAPKLSVPPNQVTGPVLSSAITSLTLGSGSLSVTYTRAK